MLPKMSLQRAQRCSSVTWIWIFMSTLGQDRNLSVNTTQTRPIFQRIILTKLTESEWNERPWRKQLWAQHITKSKVLSLHFESLLLRLYWSTGFVSGEVKEGFEDTDRTQNCMMIILILLVVITILFEFCCNWWVLIHVWSCDLCTIKVAFMTLYHKSCLYDIASIFFAISVDWRNGSGWWKRSQISWSRLSWYFSRYHIHAHAWI